jgi:hypothetical protein
VQDYEFNYVVRDGVLTHAPDAELHRPRPRRLRRLAPPASVPRASAFFDLGGHSLLTPVLVARLAQRLGVKISLRTFMTDSSVRAIDGYLDRQYS